MARTTNRYSCAESDCHEVGYIDYDTKARAREHARELHNRGGWRCTRHTKPDEVLSPTNWRRTVVMTAERSKRFPDLAKLFWREEGREFEGSGFTFGPGFKAWADDFPEGTVLTVTTTVSPPTTDRTEPA